VAAFAPHDQVRGTEGALRILKFTASSLPSTASRNSHCPVKCSRNFNSQAELSGAGERIRTVDSQLGKLMHYRSDETVERYTARPTIGRGGIWT